MNFDQSFINDTWIPWTSKSNDTDFKSTIKCVGNGEQKLAKELDITSTLGGQNSVIDLEHPIIGSISIKDITHDDCTLGTEGCHKIRSCFRKIVYPLISWCEKYQDYCEYAQNIIVKLKEKYGSSRTTIFEGIERFELCSSNFKMLDKILNDIIIAKENLDISSLNSEYIIDICNNLSNTSFIDICNNCVRQEAINMTLIIVHESKGWMIVKNLKRITCPRITRGAPRINVNLDTSLN